MALKDLQVNIGANTTGFNKGIKTVQSGIKSMGSGLASCKSWACFSRHNRRSSGNSTEL